MKKAKWGHQRELNCKYAENNLFLEFVIVTFLDPAGAGAGAGAVASAGYKSWMQSLFYYSFKMISSLKTS